MLNSQQVVVKWIEYAAAGAMLLLAAKLAVNRLRQPADRINLILMALVAAAIVPLLIAFAPLPVWRLGIVAAAAAEATSLPRPPRQRQYPDVQSDVRPASSEFNRLPAGESAKAAETAPVSKAPAPTVASPKRRSVWELAAIGLATIYGAAIAWFVAECLLGVRCLRRLSARAVPAGTDIETAWESVTQGQGKSVRLLISNQAKSPLAFGCLRPTVIIPEAIAAGDPSALRFCLAHEWSHVERADLFRWRAAWYCQFLLWFQPLFWMLRRELRVCQDLLADYSAANGGRDAIQYSEMLLELARQGAGRPVAGAMAFLDQSGQLSRRIKMLLASPITLRSRSRLAFCLAAGSAWIAGALLVGSVRLDSVRADDAPAASPKPAEKDRTAEQPVAAKPEQPETLRYTGVILDKETGKGIPGAAVVVRRSKLTPQENTMIQETQHKTDAEGKYSFEIPPEQVVPWMYIELDVEHDEYAAKKGFGYALSMIRKNEKLGERPFFEKVELQASDPITGTVVDPDGKPLTGVKIQGYSKSNATDFRDYGSFTYAATNDAGKFRLNLVKGGVGVFWVLPTEYASTSRAVNKERGDVGEVRLRPGVRVAGRVLSVDGRPVPNIPVNIEYQGGGNETVNNLPVATSIERSDITDAEGRFAFDPLPSGEYRVIPEEHRSDPIIRDRTRYDLPSVFLPMKVTLQEGVAAAPIEVQASPHVLFNAQILDSKGAKTRGHEVHVFGRMDGQSWFGQGRPNPEGTISMRIPHGLQEVQLNLMTNEHGALRFRRGKGKELENFKMRVDLSTLNDDVDGFEIIHYKAPIVLVGAVDAEGNPIKDFHVTAAYPWGEQRYILDGELRSDLSFEHQNDGRYRTSQMLPDEDVKFTLTAKGYETAIETVRLAEGETKDLVVTLKKAAESKAESEPKTE